MSMGGHSLHKQDYLQMALMAAAGTAGAGAAGIGPMAGMLAGSAPEMGASGGAFGMGDRGLGLAEDLTGGGFTGGPSGMRSAGLLSSLGGGLKNFGRTAYLLQGAGLNGQPPVAPMGPRGGGAPPPPPIQLYPQEHSDQLPLTLAGLSPDDPLVIEWKKQHGVMT